MTATPAMPSEPQETLGALILGFALVAVFMAETIITAFEKAEANHLRSKRKKAFGLRHRWRSSDVPRLRLLGINPHQILPGKGRPVVELYTPLHKQIPRVLDELAPLFLEESSAAERRKAFRAWPWWEYRVEALFRGEYQIAKLRRLPAPAENSEQKVADALRISPATVHSICVKARKSQKERDESGLPAMTLTEYEEWMATGKTEWLN